LEVLLVQPDTAQNRNAITLKAPQNYKIAPETNFVFIAYDSQNGTCPVQVDGSRVTHPDGRMVIERLQQTSGANMFLSFSTVLEIVV
jgi:hypothetical protein